jgi:L-aspartate oxidase
VWREAGIVREPEGLRRLLADEHPLARMIARSAIARTESRGAHLRSDHPEQDPAFDQRHAVVPADGEIEWQTWA